MTEPPPDTDVDVLTRSVMAAWSEQLGFELVDPRANVFDLGANSFQAAAIALGLRRRFQVEVPIRIVFDHPTAEATAVQLSLLVHSS